ncbi:MAG: hypothetical protein FAF03_03690 [Epsilonproteobacteria bacterium]|nr:hypothetical protein [Campylobacterota bacterium]
MRFLTFFIFFILGCLALFILLIWGQTGNPTKMSQWVDDVYEKKRNIAQSIKTKKIILVSGSNALFGVDSRMLEDTFKLPVVNYSVNAGIELPLTLFKAQEVIHKGDTVIMPLEYPMYSYDGTAGVQMIDYLLAREPKYFTKLTLQEQFYIVWHITVNRIIEGYIDSENTPVTKGIYGAHHVNVYGDQIKTEIKYRSKKMYKDMLKTHLTNPEAYGVTYDQNNLGWIYLEEFVKWCEDREVKVIFMPSTIMQDSSYFTSKKEKWFYSHIAEVVRNKGWNYIGDPYDYMYDKELYFNTNFHLIDSARKMRTEKMIEDLLKHNIML